MCRAGGCAQSRCCACVKVEGGLDEPLCAVCIHQSALCVRIGELNPKDSATDCYCLLAHNTQGSVTLGTYTVRWRRCGDSSSQVLTSAVSFPPVAAKYQPYTVSAGMCPYMYAWCAMWCAGCNREKFLGVGRLFSMLLVLLNCLAKLFN